MGAVSAHQLAEDADGDTSSIIAARVEAAFQRQLARQKKEQPAIEFSGSRPLAPPRAQGRSEAAQLDTAFHWSARAWCRILRVAHTIADLDGSEAIQYRRALREG